MLAVHGCETLQDMSRSASAAPDALCGPGGTAQTGPAFIGDAAPLAGPLVPLATLASGGRDTSKGARPQDPILH